MIMTGIRVSASTSDAPTDVTTDSDRSRNSAAASPFTNTIGPNTSSVVSVPAMSGPLTSFVAAIVAGTRSSPSSRLLAVASATTIALSTSKPTPSARPPSDRMFTVTSSSCSSTSATSTLSGTMSMIASDSRRFRRNRRITSTERIAPATISWPRFDSASDTNCACAATSVSVMSGKSARSRSTAAKSPSVTCTVFEPASLYTTSPTPGAPSSRVIVRGSATVTLMVATSRSRYFAFTGPTGVSAISSGVRNSVMARTEKRNWPRRIVPPAPLAFAALTAVAMSSGVRPSARILSGSASIRISSSGDPTTATLAMPAICSRRRACTSRALRAIDEMSPLPVSASTAIGRSPGSLVRSVGRSAVDGSWLRALSSRSRTLSTVVLMSVPHANCSVVVTDPFRLTLRRSTRPGVAATASSTGSATNRDISSAAAPDQLVRTVSTGSVTSGSSDTGSLDSDTLPSSTTASTLATVVTGRRMAASIQLTGVRPYGRPVSRVDTTRTGASCVSVRCPSVITRSPAAIGICPVVESARISRSRPLERPGFT